MNDLIKQVMEKYLTESIGDINNETTRLGIRDGIALFLKGLYNNKKLEDYAVVCDETNNSPTRIDNKELVIDVYFHKPGSNTWTWIRGEVGDETKFQMVEGDRTPL
jgi:phage tail sheath protein FI